MVTTTQGVTSLRWPTGTAKVGDFIVTDDTNTAYEFMPNGTWKNIVVEKVYDDFSVSYEAGISTGAANPNNGPITLYNEETIKHGDRIYEVSVNGSEDYPAYRQLYVSSPATLTAYHLTSHSGLPFIEDGSPFKPIFGWDVWTWGKNISGFNRPHTLKTAIPLVDYIQDPSRMDEVKVKIDWGNANGLPITVGGHTWVVEMFEDGRASKNYSISSPTFNLRFSEAVPYPINSPAIPPRSISTGWLDMASNSFYLWYTLTYNPGQHIGGWTLTIDDPTYTGNDGTSSTSGMCMDLNGNNLYFVRESTVGKDAILRSTLSTSHDLSTKVDAETVTSYYDPNEDPFGAINAGNCCITDDGRDFFITDRDTNAVHQFKLRTNYQISDIASVDPFNSFIYTEYKKEFTPDGVVLDIFVNRAKATLLVLTDNNKITKYTFENQDISTAIYESEYDITEVASGAKCLTMTYAESSILLAIPEGVRYLAVEAGIDLSTVKTSQDLVKIPSIDPRGIAVSKDSKKIFIADNHTIDPTLRVTQWDAI